MTGTTLDTSRAGRPDFGALLHERGNRLATWVLGGIMGELALGVVAMLCYFEMQGGPKGTGKNMVRAMFIGLTAVGCMIWLAVVAVKKAGVRVQFCDRGTVMMRFGRVRSAIPHAEVSSVRLGVTRQYYNGIYAGTVFGMSIEAPGHATIRLRGKHKEKTKGLGFTILHKKFTGHDEIQDAVVHIARGMVAHLLEKESGAEGPRLNWAGRATISMDGITPAHGPLGGRLVRYKDIRGMAAENGHYAVFANGVPEAVVVIPTGAPNFYVGVEFARAAQAASGVGGEGEAA